MPKELGKGTKKLILDVAYGLFAELGYEQTPVSLIMERAGKSKATFYSHYKRKEDIMLDIIDQQVYRNFNFIQEVVIPYIRQDNFEILEFFTGYFQIGLHLEDRKDWTLVYNDLIRLSVHDEVIRMKLSKAHDNWLKLFDTAIKRGIELKQLPEDLNKEAIINSIFSLYKGIHLERVYGSGPNMEQIHYFLKRLLS
ncbi:TetR/AcrR family transcriptional regulator [Cytobacillus oceanisediminis]|uniref:TetR/AcrR family transcriptional regulator n=1 Tax=Cytobacillus oceanisediminis TaxID=665099 RepID=UPI001FB21308|nr:TetR/AcrR family transcriptional regulator [Cytobacillus oceanisediminis]UOE53490.1 TetR/AcrR family transcriptional regulator [Cytobacillus oceanisediminis]